ncbi:unnamed protein product, partial [Effrenium voratum]
NAFFRQALETSSQPGHCPGTEAHCPALRMRAWPLWPLLVAAQVDITVRPRYNAVTAGSEHRQVLVVDVTPPPVSEDPAQELALVLDVSLSMADKLTLVKAAVRHIVRGLRSIDRIHLIACHSLARVEFANATVAQQAAVLAALDALEPRSGVELRPIDGSAPVKLDISNISEALWLAQKVLVGPDASTAPSVTRRAMLFSDGELQGPLARHYAVLDALERTKMAGVPTTVVAVGSGKRMGRWLLEAAAKAGQGDFFYLSDPESFQQVLAAASPGHYPMTFGTKASLRIAASFGARVARTYGHRRRREHQRGWSSDWEGLPQTQELPLGVLRSGRLERLLIVLDLPVYRYGADLLKYELLYEQDGTSRSQWHAFTQHVALPEDAEAFPRIPREAPWAGADLLYRLEEFLLQQEELREEEEVAEAQSLPLPGTRGDSRWAQLAARWDQLRSGLQLLAREAAQAQRQNPSLADLGIVAKVWRALDTAHAGPSTAPSYLVCQGAPEFRLVPQGPEGLGFPP